MAVVLRGQGEEGGGGSAVRPNCPRFLQVIVPALVRYTGKNENTEKKTLE